MASRAKYVLELCLIGAITFAYNITKIHQDPDLEIWTTLNAASEF